MSSSYQRGRLLLKGLRSTNAITWARQTGKIINHILPTNDYTKSTLEITRVQMSDYPQNLIFAPYKELEDTEDPSLKTIDGRVSQREKWYKKCPALR